jgi:hypothetical protein
MFFSFKSQPGHLTPLKVYYFFGTLMPLKVVLVWVAGGVYNRVLFTASGLLFVSVRVV